VYWNKTAQRTLATVYWNKTAQRTLLYTETKQHREHYCILKQNSTENTTLYWTKTAQRTLLYTETKQHREYYCILKQNSTKNTTVYWNKTAQRTLLYTETKQHREHYCILKQNAAQGTLTYTQTKDTEQFCILKQRQHSKSLATFCLRKEWRCKLCCRINESTIVQPAFNSRIIPVRLLYCTAVSNIRATRRYEGLRSNPAQHNNTARSPMDGIIREKLRLWAGEGFVVWLKPQ
jgi:hypothetical protein